MGLVELGSTEAIRVIPTPLSPQRSAVSCARRAQTALTSVSGLQFLQCGNPIAQ
jgi:hypothetical protein